ncbi:YTH-domain-containing protein, partial [Ramicandelaber brevisporus]
MKARFFVIKSFTQSDVQKSVKHGFWSSTIPGNERLDSAYSNPPPEYDPNDPNPQPWPVYLFFSINGSSRFCGVARMSSSVDRTKSSDVWDLAARWTGLFNVEWLFIRDVPNSELRHIVLSATDPRPVTNSRDTQELPLNAGRQMLSVF